MKQGMGFGAMLAAAVLVATAAAPAAEARDHDRRGHSYSQRGHDRGWDRRDDRRHGHDRRDDRRHDRRHDRRDRYVRDRYVHVRPAPRVHYAPPRHVGPPPWARGRYVHHYQRPVYVVNDYYGYGLRHPPHGHRWMRDDYGDLILVAIATGLIADLVLNR